jgi:putative chitinase
MEITVDILKQLAPGGKKSGFKYFAGLSLWMNKWFPEFDIDTKGELCHILAQLAHESDSFNAMEEYASGQAYEGRLDLGNNTKGDGIKFKGRGVLQITGRTNYKLMGVKAGYPNKFTDNPSLLATPEWAVWSACIFWTDRGLLDISNMPDTAQIPSKKLGRNLSPLEYITWRVNGGFNNFKEREGFYEKAKTIISF